MPRQFEIVMMCFASLVHSCLYHVLDVVLLFRQLHGWFELHVLSILVVGGPCCFLGILGMLHKCYFAHHSVRISDSNVDNIVTLYRLKCASGCPADCT